MRTLRLAAWRDRPIRVDPAPSRVAYRITRFWLSPRLRRIVTHWLPAAAVTLGLAGYLAHPDRQSRMRGAVAEVVARLEARPEFQLRHLEITGASPILAQAIRDRLGLSFPISWFDIDTDALHERIAALDAVAGVTVQVEIGGGIAVEVTERQPALLWRRSGGLEILDATGHRIAFLDRRDGRPDLPLVTGPGADRAAPEALALFAAAGPLRDRVRGFTRQGERRWDVVLDRDQVIRLPSEGAQAALQRVLAMDRATDLLARDVVGVDLRNPARPTVQLGPDAQAYLRDSRAFVEGLSAP